MKYKPLLKFMQARHSIYLARAAGAAAPWTEDEILKKYKFTNVYRELDRVTIWVRENIREPFADHPHLWFMLCMARQINWPPTLQALIGAGDGAWPFTRWDWRTAMRVLRKRAESGEKVYTGAYMLTANAGGRLNKVKGAFDKPEITCRLVLDELWRERETIKLQMTVSIEHAVDTLKQHTGFKGFMAYEVASDLRYTRYLETAPDNLTWAHAGPGAKRGLNRLLGRDAKARPYLNDADALGAMRTLLSQISIVWPYQPALEMREIEHSLCEFDKYERARNGEGRPRSYFRPNDGGW